jgi:hypothetical protein
MMILPGEERDRRDKNATITYLTISLAAYVPLLYGIFLRPPDYSVATSDGWFFIFVGVFLGLLAQMIRVDDLKRRLKEK